jgi:glutamate racemase
MNTNKIGFLDSGFGGITVLSEALEDSFQKKLHIFADIEHVPMEQRQRKK